MNQRIGLVGAHRVGKSTLYMALMHSTVLRGLNVSISDWQAEENYDSSKMDYSFEDRRYIQEHLLKKFERLLTMGNRITRDLEIDQISERTPLDLIGYAVACAPSEPSAAEIEWLKDYTQRCIELTNARYDEVFLIQPGIPFVDADKSPDSELVGKLNDVYLSLMINPQLKCKRVILDEDLTDLEDRVAFIKENSDVLS